MKKTISILLTVLMLVTAVPISAQAADRPRYDADTPCLERDLPHGDALWQEIYELEKALPEKAEAEDYAAVTEKVEAAVRSSREVAEGSVFIDGDTLNWETLDGMAHRYSPQLRAEINGYAGEAAEKPSAVQKAVESIGAGAEDATGFGSTTAKNIAVFEPYYGLSSDNWNNCDEALIKSLANLTGGTYSTYLSTNATIEALADALESCAVVIVNTHGSVDKRGAMNDTSMSNTSYLTLLDGTGITSADCEWESGRCGEFRHAFNGGSPPEAPGQDVYFIDGTAIANHMDKTSPNTLLWMDSCLTMATDGLAAPLRDKGVGVVLGYSKPISSAGGGVYKNFFFDSLQKGEPVTEAAAYMKRMSGSSWDPVYKVTESEAVAAGIAFPVFVSSIDSYPGQYNVDGVQTVMSGWRLPFKDESNYATKEALVINSLQRVDCRFRFTPNLTSVKLTSGSLPDGMKLYWSASELYVRGTPTKKGSYNATFTVTDSVQGTITHRVSLIVYGSSTTSGTTDITFNSGKAYSKTIADSCLYYQIVSGFYPRLTTLNADSGALKFSSNSGAPAGDYSVVCYTIDKNYTRCRRTINITIDPKNSYTLSNVSVTMARGCKGIVQINEDSFHSVTVTRGALPDGTMVIGRNSLGVNIIGTPTETGTFTATLRMSVGWSVYNVNVTVNVAEPANVNASINRYSMYGSLLGTTTRRCNTTYTLPEFKGTVPNNRKFSGWFYNKKTYQPGETITVNAMQIDFYAMSEYTSKTAIKEVSCTIGQPVGGTHPDMYPVSGDSSQYTVKLSNWQLNRSPYTTISASGTFTQGKQYSVSVVFTPRPGYTLDSNTKYIINGKAPVKGEGGVAIAVYTAAAPSISKLDCMLDEPIAGKHPDYTAIPTYAGYTTSVSLWYLNKKPEYTHLSATDVFAKNSSYRVRVTFTPVDGCVVADGAAYTINGKKATAVGTRTYEVIFSAITPISSVKVSGAASAVAGKSAGDNPPQFTMSNTHCTFTARGWTYLRLISVSPIRISYPAFTGTFESGKTYYPQLTLKPDSGYIFADEVKVTFDDGYSFTAYPLDDGTITVRGNGVVAKSGTLIGDVNNDGVVNGADAGLLSRYTSGWKGYESKIKNMAAADINGDGNVNGADSGILARYTSGWKQYDKYFS